MVSIPSVCLRDGNKCPVLGFETGITTQEDDVQTLVEDAIDFGCRYIDCAYVDQNEKEVGLAIVNKITQGVVGREDLFIGSKLWNNSHDRKEVFAACQLSLKNLKLSYLDMYLMHWPFAFKSGPKLLPMEASDKISFDESIDFIDTWRAMEDLQKEGYVKSIGVCNFNKDQLLRIKNEATILPAVNQIECHPYLNQWDLCNFCKKNGIFVVSYCPYGKNWPEIENMNENTSIRLEGLCSRNNKSHFQILLRYEIQLQNIVLVKSLKKGEFKYIVDIFDFNLKREEMEYLKEFERNSRLYRFENAASHKYYPFSEKNVFN